MLKVLRLGLYSSIQDLGRKGCQQYGVPVSGVMDRQSAALANALLGNDENDAVIEVTMMGPKLQFFKSTIICISGADLSPEIHGKSINLNAAVVVNKGDVLSFGKLQYGIRCYLAIQHGFQSEIVMGSRSMYQGITASQVLAQGQELHYKDSEVNLAAKHVAVNPVSNLFKEKQLKVYKGPEFDCLNNAQIKGLLDCDFTISKDHSRMGYRLQEPLCHNLKTIITSAVMPGTVQLTPSGQLIVLMRDAQTTGGYPRVLQLSAEAINVLSQKNTGQSVCFKLVQ